MRKLFLLAILSIALISTAQTSPTKKTMKVLFVGNSYTYYNNLPQLVSYISDSTGIKLVTKKSTVGGAYLSEHWKGSRGLKTKTMIRDGKFDAVILQDNSMGGIERADSLRKYVKLFADYVRSTGAKPYLMQTWARNKVPQYDQDLNKIMKEVSKDNNISIIPVGQGWNIARKHRPQAPLFDNDGSHPANLGTFLSAAIITGHLTGQVPEKINQVPTIIDKNGETLELIRIDWLDMIFAMKVAKETLGNGPNK